MFPASRARVWRLLSAHTDEATLQRIHPWIRPRRVLKEEHPGGYEKMTFNTVRIVERDIAVAGRVRESVWTYRVRPGEEYSYRIDLAEGSWMHIENDYADEGGATRIGSRVSFSLGSVPAFFQRLVIGRILARADREDRAYVRRMNP